MVRLVHGAGTAEEVVEDLPLHAIDHSRYLGMLSSLYVPPISQGASFESFQEIIARLRASDGCPWDREQTHLSLRPFLLEETYEALDALDREDMADLREELGDLLLQILLHAQIATEEGDFNIHDVLEAVGTKLIRRHPHVFSEIEVDGVSGVIHNWEVIKAEERLENGSETKSGLLDGVPQALPSLSQAQAVIERVGKVAFDLLVEKGASEVIQKILQRFEEDQDTNRGVVLGDLLLAVAALAYRNGIDAESALRENLAKFRSRFSGMEARAAAAGVSLMDMGRDEKLKLWQQTGEENREMGAQ